MPEIVESGKRYFLRNLGLFVWGLVWAIVGSLGPAATQLIIGVTKYRDYPIDWTQIEYSALSGTAIAMFGYWRSHQNLLAIPDEYRRIIDAAQVSQNESVYGSIPPPSISSGGANR